MVKTYVFGHKSPDSDSITSSIVMANLENELGNSEHKVPVLELPSATDEIKTAMDEKVFDQPIRDRGMSIKGFVVESVTLDDESEKKIDNYELSSNSFMQQGSLVGDYGKAVKDAAKAVDKICDDYAIKESIKNGKARGNVERYR